MNKQIYRAYVYSVSVNQYGYNCINMSVELEGDVNRWYNWEIPACFLDFEIVEESWVIIEIENGKITIIKPTK